MDMPSAEMTKYAASNAGYTNQLHERHSDLCELVELTLKWFVAE